MICPQCRSEFVPGHTMCPDCNVPLVGAVPAERHDQTEWLEAIETADPGLLPVLESVLAAAGIPCMVAGEEAVGVLPLGLPDTRFAQSGIAARLLVPADRLKEARKLLATTASTEIQSSKELENGES